ncbi:uncharacterized protein LOC101211269 isoform X2 [Cucumis sativus]|uniref:uncharacterized protein LOC101211269 isoform X2 n=1 Tax=Cucumis sativus TaxID=3659 RepID=UPI0012F4B234|nr:uncharacterized protein LOC101211269 isoform X2 [Cucumis sativus]
MDLLHQSFFFLSLWLERTPRIFDDKVTCFNNIYHFLGVNFTLSLALTVFSYCLVQMFLAILLTHSLPSFMLEPARSTQRLKSYLRSKKNLEKVAMNNVKQAPFKKLKSLSSSTGLSAHEDCANLGSSMMIDDELQFFLDNYSEQIEDVVAKFSNDLSGTLGHMEQQLEEVLDSVLSNFRPMTFKEKEELQKLIQKLPPENIRRVAEIVIQHRTDKTDLSGEIHIGLDKENNTTLWRLYYYVEAVEKAKKLASK